MPESHVSAEAPPAMVRDRHKAYILELSAGCQVAIPAYTAYEVLEAPEVATVPCMPPWILGMTRWSDTWIPLVDLASLFDGDPPAQDASALRFALVVAHGEGSGQLGFAAVRLCALPRMVEVDDAAAAEPAAANPPQMQALTVACFLQDAGPVPILDLSLLFG